ncbi:MAG TPA: molybdate ABC transporter substrate-binding protein [Candidatus Dormibacteraeota bacterium]|nr:molybdate ABC transporter substrate-binding protein [Candidatus Dormibacteraeota bacterium]
MIRGFAGLMAAAVLCACGSTGAPADSLTGTLNVFAASSLTDAFKGLGSAFERQHPGLSVRFNFAGSPALVAQIEDGAQADVFASADTTNMDRLLTDGLLAYDPSVFAHNKLEIVVASGNPKQITSLADLAKPGVVYISAGPTVPAGKYAAQVLREAGVTVTPKSLETDVKSVVAKIELGEADAGIVYVTDVKAAGSKVTGVTIQDADNVVATYPIAPVKAATQLQAADKFVAYVISSEGQAKLKEYGFLGA